MNAKINLLPCKKHKTLPYLKNLLGEGYVSAFISPYYVCELCELEKEEEERYDAINKLIQEWNKQQEEK